MLGFDRCIKNIDASLNLLLLAISLWLCIFSQFTFYSSELLLSKIIYPVLSFPEQQLLAGKIKSGNLTVPYFDLPLPKSDENWDDGEFSHLLEA